MNKALLKNYAPQARQDFIAAVIARAQRIGITEKGISSAEKSGDSIIIDGQAYPAKFGQKRDKLVARIDKDGFSQTMEAVAYTWFNRFAALRYLEIHEYLPHGHGVLSSKDGVVPDILTHAAEIAQNGDLADLNAAEVIDMKLAGDKDGELYRLMLLAQCKTLSNSMPFLFEKIDDETELLLPDNLLLTDSVIAKLVAAIPEEDWQEIEIIGWLYQFYISEKKDAVIGKVVKSEDIPAATQLFTPNWIVKYLVQNSVGRLWSMANPDSSSKTNWDYYIEPAEQSPEVQAQLSQLMQTRLDENGGSLNPETLKILDPACGSGHILVEAYDILKDIYLERGYRLRDIPRLILEKNLYGLDIDDRAAQLAGFALLMKARADDRRILENPPKLNIFSLVESGEWQVPSKSEELATHYSSLITLFKHAKTFGSLIQIPSDLAAQLPALEAHLLEISQQGDLLDQLDAMNLLPLVAQAHILAMKFDAVVANPPYMGGKGMNGALKDFAKKHFPDSKSDLFAMFIERGFGWCKASGFNAQVTMQSWMFLSSYEAMREKLLSNHSLNSLLQMPYDGKSPTAMGINFGVTSFVFQNAKIDDVKGDFDCFRFFELTEDGLPQKFPSQNERNVLAKPDDFKKISGSPVAYWVSDKVRDIFSVAKRIGDIAEAKQGLATADNNQFIRQWQEIEFNKIGFGLKNVKEANDSKNKFFPYNKGGEFRKWYGNHLFVVNWEEDGKEIKNFCDADGNVRSRPQNTQCYFKSSVSWSDITSGIPSFRFFPDGFMYDVTGMSAQSEDEAVLMRVLAFCNSKVVQWIAKTLNPTMHFQVGNYASLPALEDVFLSVNVSTIQTAIKLAKIDWNNYETSWDFTDNPLIRQLSGELLVASGEKKTNHLTLATCFEKWQTQNRAAIDEMKRLEEENNRLFIEAYGLLGELSPDVPEEQITLVRADREKDSVRLISYAIGCMMGRYSLDEAGLIYAGGSMVRQAHHERFSENKDSVRPELVEGHGSTGSPRTELHLTVRPELVEGQNNGIIPITDEFWFEDDAAQRLNEFLQTVWGAESLENNKNWLAESIGQKTSETADETLRRYLASNFYKDHLQTYKKRPIYWLFSSGKQGAFQALVYLHRYNESTLARMRNHYVVPLMGRLQNRIEMLEKDRDAATSPASKNKIGKEIERFNKKKMELTAFDEKLRHYADMRISLDLDDGVKVNYGKFGDLLSEVKAVTGGSSDE